MSALKRLLARGSVHPIIRPLTAGLIARRPAVFMLHRFADPDEPGIDVPRVLRESLAALRRARVPLVSLRSMVADLLAGRPQRGVAFTVDDAYADFGSAGAPVFAEFDVPVTVFVPTGFVDGLYWFWWDKFRVALRDTHARSMRIDGVDLPLRDSRERAAAFEAAVAWVKRSEQDGRDARVALMLEQLEVSLPERAPHDYAPLSWSEIRSLADTGVDFGPHTVNHPTAASLDAAQIRWEVRTSMSRLRAEIEDPAPIFCYPFGTSADIAEASARAVREEGLTAAVSAQPGYLAERHRSDPYQLPRFSFPEHDVTELLQVAFGVERLKEIVRTKGRG